MDERLNLRITAAMEGQRVVLKKIGSMVNVSGMELMLLVNFAMLGQFYLFSHCDGEDGMKAEAEIGKIIESIRAEFSPDGTPDGLALGIASITAILTDDRFSKYLIR